MKRYILPITLALVIAATTAFAQGKSVKKKAVKVKAEKVLTDTCPSHGSDIFMVDDMMREMSRSSRSFYREAMKMMEEMPDFEGMMGIPDRIAGFDSFFGDDSTSVKSGTMSRKARAGKRSGVGKRIVITTDTSGKRESLMVISRDGKTTIVRNGKDTTVVDGPFVPERDMPDMKFDFLVPPACDFGPRFEPRFRNRNEIVRQFRGGSEAESPSVQELDMLVKKGVVSSKEVEKLLEIDDLSLMQNRKNGTVRISYEVENADRSELQLINPDGQVVEKVALIGNGGQFIRTIKLDKSLDYVFVVISSSGKVSVNKFWL